MDFKYRFKARFWPQDFIDIGHRGAGHILRQNGTGLIDGV
jgi:hypothetical protein